MQLADYAGRPGWRGRLNFDREFIKARLKETLSGGQQLLLHVVGNATAGLVLDLMQDLAPSGAWAPRRVRFEHANGVVGDNIARARDFGVVVAQPRPTHPFQAWLRGGLKVAYGSDEGFLPWAMFKTMTSEANPNRIAREEALSVLTSAPAWSEGMEDQKGQIAVGRRADIAVLSQDVLVCPAEGLDRTTSVMTMVGGQVAFKA